MSGKQRKRSRRTAKGNGTRMESAVESYLQWALDDLRIQRLRLHGSKDIGDIGNVFFHGRPVCIEVMDAMLALSPPYIQAIIKPEPLGRKKTMRLITLQEFAMMLNDGLSLGPDREDW